VKVTPLPETVKILLAELFERLLAVGTGDLPASFSFVSKAIGAQTYWYLQRSEGAGKRQIYLGPESPALLASMETAKQQKLAARQDREQISQIVGMLGRGGAFAESAALCKVLTLLAEARVFHLGGVLVGTPAFAAYGNLLGVRFEEASLRTLDIDIAQDPAIAVALAGDTEPASVPAVLESSVPPFLPIPGLDPRKPSTSFSVRGKELRVDFLTPLRGKDRADPIYLPLFKVAAQPLRLLDYLIENPVQAAIFDRRQAVLVQVPDPARFAWHKLWVAQSRAVVFQNKARKDLLQARQLLAVLREDRPDDLAVAWQALSPHPKAIAKIRRSLAKLPEIVPGLEELVGEKLS
jgi:hypothetical protein